MWHLVILLESSKQNLIKWVRITWLALPWRYYFTGLFFTSQNTKVHLVICTIHVFFSLWCFLLSFPFSLFIIWIKILFVLRNYFESIEALTRVFFIINLFLTRLTAIQYCAWSWHLGSNLLRYSLFSWRLLIPLLFHF